MLCSVNVCCEDKEALPRRAPADLPTSAQNDKKIPTEQQETEEQQRRRRQQQQQQQVPVMNELRERLAQRSAQIASDESIAQQDTDVYETPRSATATTTHVDSSQTSPPARARKIFINLKVYRLMLTAILSLSLTTIRVAWKSHYRNFHHLIARHSSSLRHDK